MSRELIAYQLRVLACAIGAPIATRRNHKDEEQWSLALENLAFEVEALTPAEPAATVAAAPLWAAGYCVNPSDPNSYQPEQPATVEGWDVAIMARDYEHLDLSDAYKVSVWCGDACALLRTQAAEVAALRADAEGLRALLREASDACDGTKGHCEQG